MCAKGTNFNTTHLQAHPFAHQLQACIAQIWSGLLWAHFWFWSIVLYIHLNYVKNWLKSWPWRLGPDKGMLGAHPLSMIQKRSNLHVPATCANRNCRDFTKIPDIPASSLRGGQGYDVGGQGSDAWIANEIFAILVPKIQGPAKKVQGQDNEKLQGVFFQTNCKLPNEGRSLAVLWRQSTVQLSKLQVALVCLPRFLARSVYTHPPLHSWHGRSHLLGRVAAIQIVLDLRIQLKPSGWQLRAVISQDVEATTSPLSQWGNLLVWSCLYHVWVQHLRRRKNTLDRVTLALAAGIRINSNTSPFVIFCLSCGCCMLWFSQDAESLLLHVDDTWHCRTGWGSLKRLEQVAFGLLMRQS